jgi:cytidylate kinase
MMKKLTIAIDGPAASGKSTLAQSLANDLDYLYFDTGVLYRAVTYAALQQGVDLQDGESVTRLAEMAVIDVEATNGGNGTDFRVLLDGADISGSLRTPEVDAHVSQVAAYRGVRQALNAQQRRIGMRGGVVMVGRDIGTVVLPEADLKIFLDASVEERARRRYEEAQAEGIAISFEEIAESIRQRDKNDAERDTAPLKPADDSTLIESDGLDIPGVLARAKALVAEKMQDE